MFSDISFLRVLGIAAGLILLFEAFRRLRSSATGRFDVWLIAFSGLALALIGLFPNIVNTPSDMLNMTDKPGGRIITLLVILTGLLWALMLNERAKTESIRKQFDNLVRYVARKDFWDSHGAGSISPDVMILMPAYNEAENLALVLPRIPKEINGSRIQVLVLNDGSADDTEATAKNHGAIVVNNPFNRGGGAALRLGYDIAENLGADVVVTMDADGQHQPEEIERLVKPVLSGEADVIIGSRVLGSRDKDSAVRWVGVHVFNWLINMLMGTDITDCSSGFRAFRLSAITKRHLVQEQYHTAELIIVAAKDGLKIKEAPIHISKRLEGKSKKGANFLYGLNFFRAIIKAWVS